MDFLMTFARYVQNKNNFLILKTILRSLFIAVSGTAFSGYVIYGADETADQINSVGPSPLTAK
jgi:hypothetical protein